LAPLGGGGGGGLSCGLWFSSTPVISFYKEGAVSRATTATHRHATHARKDTHARLARPFFQNRRRKSYVLPHQQLFHFYGRGYQTYVVESSTARLHSSEFRVTICNLLKTYLSVKNNTNLI
jgi:hypothetical protein